MDLEEAYQFPMDFHIFQCGNSPLWAMIFGCRFLPGKASDDQNAATRGALQTTCPQMEAGVGKVLFLWAKTM
jgi:hypothetical protein